MGNSNGSLADYWDVIDVDARAAGRVHLGVEGPRPAPRGCPTAGVRFAYGGQFGEQRQRRQLRRRRPDVGRPRNRTRRCTRWRGSIGRSSSHSGRLAPHSRSTTAAASPTCPISTRRGSCSSTAPSSNAGDLAVGDVAPGATVTMPLPCSIPASGDAHVTLRWTQRRATPWAPAGHLVAWDQLALHPEKSPDRHAQRHKRAPFRVGSGAASEMVRDRHAQRNNPGIFREGGGPELCLWRAGVDNDGFKLMPELRARSGDGSDALARWQALEVDRRAADELVGHRHEVEATAEGGEIHRHEVVVPPTLGDLPRVGVTFELPRRLRATALVRARTTRELSRSPSRSDARHLGVRCRRAAVPRTAGVRAADRLPLVRVHRSAGRRRDPARHPRTAVRCTSRPPVSLRPTSSTPLTRPTFDRGGRSSSTPTSPIGDWAPRAAGRMCSIGIGSQPGTYRFSYQLSRRAAPF